MEERLCVVLETKDSTWSNAKIHCFHFENEMHRREVVDRLRKILKSKRVGRRQNNYSTTDIHDFSTNDNDNGSDNVAIVTMNTLNSRSFIKGNQYLSAIHKGSQSSRKVRSSTYGDNNGKDKQKHHERANSLRISYKGNENDHLGLASYLKIHKDSITVNDLQELLMILKRKDHSFIQDFVAGNGLTNLCMIGYTYNFTRKVNPILEVLFDLFELILDTSDANGSNIGFNLIFEHQVCIKTMADILLHNSNPVIKSKLLRLLTVICRVDPKGYEKVCHWLVVSSKDNNLSKRNRNSDENDYTTFLDSFVSSMYWEKNIIFRRDALKFMNVLIGLTPKPEDRIDAFRLLQQLGFNGLLSALNADIENRIFRNDNESKDDDNDDESLRRKGMYVCI